MVDDASRCGPHAANIGRAISTHSFRHSCATHVLRAGAPIRHLQEMLGHASIETTQIYTRLTITDLKAAHRRFHPRERDGELTKNSSIHPARKT
jgi:integrase/recombinase XerD